MEAQEKAIRIQPTGNKGGTWVVMGAEEYRIPPLGFGAIRELQDRMSAIQGMTELPSAEQMSIVAEIVLLSMRRNYPSITLEEIVDKLDLGNFRQVFEAVLATSGYRRAESGEAQAISR